MQVFLKIEVVLVLNFFHLFTNNYWNADTLIKSIKFNTTNDTKIFFRSIKAMHRVFVINHSEEF